MRPRLSRVWVLIKLVSIVVLIKKTFRLFQVLVPARLFLAGPCLRLGLLVKLTLLGLVGKLEFMVRRQRVLLLVLLLLIIILVQLRRRRRKSCRKRSTRRKIILSRGGTHLARDLRRLVLPRCRPLFFQSELRSICRLFRLMTLQRGSLRRKI